jgi:asparagine synthase (glutamine-hydrolysing)
MSSANLSESLSIFSKNGTLQMAGSVAEHSFYDLLPLGNINRVLEMVSDLEKIANNCVKKHVSTESLIAYSGGIDSSILAQIFSRYSNPTVLPLGRKESSDLKAVSQDPLIKRPGFLSIIDEFGIEEIRAAAHLVSNVVEVEDLSHFEDCVAFWLASSRAAKIKDIRYLISANGPDELFCGYDRFRRILDADGYSRVEIEIRKSLESAENLRNQVRRVASEFGLETREPFLEHEFKEFALKIPAEFKILKGNDMLRKRVWRCLGRAIGIPESTVSRQKKAMQYGMGIHPVVLSLLKAGKIKSAWQAS